MMTPTRPAPHLIMTQAHFLVALLEQFLYPVATAVGHRHRHARHLRRRVAPACTTPPLLASHDLMTTKRLARPDACHRSPSSARGCCKAHTSHGPFSPPLQAHLLPAASSAGGPPNGPHAQTAVAAPRPPARPVPATCSGRGRCCTASGHNAPGPRIGGATRSRDRTRLRRPRPNHGPLLGRPLRVTR